jgi:polyhydroxybutyrate depolymerase
LQTSEGNIMTKLGPEIHTYYRLAPILLSVVVILAVLWVITQSSASEPPATPSQSSPSKANLTVGPGDYDLSLVHNGLTRTYKIHVPSTYDAQSPVPLVLALHGNKGTGEDMRKLTLNQFDQLSDTENFIVVYPNGIEKSWNDGRGVTPAGEKNIDDVGFIKALIENVKGRFKIDSKRIYLTGMSNGAFFSNQLGCELSNTFAAMAPVAGTMPVIIASRCNPVRPLPVIMFHGTKDVYAPYKGGQTRKGGLGPVLSAEDTALYWARKNSCNMTPIIKKLPDSSRDGTSVTETTYSGGKEGADVVFYSIQDAGHTWPDGWQYLPRILVGKTTQNINASRTIWQFFKAHPMK